MSFTPFQKYFQKAAANYGMNKQIEAAEICHKFRKILPAIFENFDAIEEKITAGFYDKSNLTINVESPAWAQEVIMRKEQIIAEMNSQFGKEVIRNLKTQIVSRKKNIEPERPN